MANSTKARPRKKPFWHEESCICVYTGREGVWEGVTEEKVQVDDVHVEASGSCGLVEHAADAKTKALKEGFAAMEAERHTGSVEAPMLGLEDLMGMAGFNARAPLM